MTETEIQGIGFEMTKQFKHDEFYTNRYSRGVLELEFTYDREGLRTVDLTISEVNCKPVTFSELKALTQILGEW